jgi:hypothetical protein
MKKQIVRFSPFQTAKVMALLYLIISLPLVLLMAASFSAAPNPKPPIAGMMIFLPVIYMVVGFVFTIIGAWIYNLVAKWVGGIEFTTSETGNA